MRAPVAATCFPTPTGHFAMTKALIRARAVCRAPIPKWPPRESPRGVRFRTTRCRRQAELAASRANAAFALREARQRGFDEPILLNEAGDVCSGARKAVFAVRDGVLSTPPLACGVRESVDRDTVINFAMDLDVPIVEERMTRADLCIADELFLCDAVRGVIPVSSIDGCTIGKPGKAGPKPGPITKAIQERCAKMMAGKLDEYAAWIAQVE